MTDKGWLVIPRWPWLRPAKLNSWLMRHYSWARLLYPVRRGDTVTVEGDQVYVVQGGETITPPRGWWVRHRRPPA